MKEENKTALYNLLLDLFSNIKNLFWRFNFKNSVQDLSIFAVKCLE